ncbi:MAG: zinc-dependent metalloprotease [Candidatus Eremiobacteraeota bacterium]|nr:zinc-dependent metalloprotease [Candidatus Eremiobacteraeota bacterium]
MSVLRAAALFSLLVGFGFGSLPAVAQSSSAEGSPAPTSTATPRPATSPNGQAPAALPTPTPSASLPAALNALLGGATPAPQSYAQFLRNAEIQPGLIDLVRKDDDLYFDLGPEQFEKTYILAPSLASGLGAGTYAGRLYDPILVQFKRVGRRILWITPNTDFASASGSAASHALSISTADSIIASSPIVAEDTARKHVAIAPSMLLSDYLQIGSELSRAAGSSSPGGGLMLLLGAPRGGFALDTARSFYLATKALPHNDEISVNLTFSGSGNLQTVPDTRGTPIKVHYSIVEEPPRTSFAPRAADDRIGYFVETQKRFGDDTQRTPFVRYIDRWDLSAGPIVFTLTNEVPKQYRDAVKRGILEWNKAFARAGYPDAVRVDDPPSDPSFDPDDVRYNPIHWITQDRGSFVAATPHIADPLTGRILRATITIDGEAIRSLRRGFVDSIAPVRAPIAAISPYAAFAPGAAPPPADAIGANAIEAIADPCVAGLCDYSETLETDAAFAELAIDGGIRENSAQTDKFIDQYLSSVTTHEVGHALGLRHNFASSTIYSLTDVHNPSFTAKHGLVGSVMGYTPVNLAPPGKPQTTFFQSKLGPYDYWAIEYGYARASPDALRRIANRSTEPNLVFETDEDAFGAWAVDPRVVVFVLSSDPIGWHRERFEIADRLFATLDRRYPRDDRSYYDERLAFLTVLNEYTRSALVTTRWVGGAYTSRAHRGQKGGAAPFRPVPRADQARAFALLDRYVFSAKAFAFPPDLVQRLGPDRFHGWGDQGLGNRPDFPLTDFAGNLQDVVMYTLFSPINLARINDQAILAPGKTMSLDDLFEWSRKAVYDDVASGSSIPPLHRELQRRFTDLLLTIAMLPSLGIDQLRMPYATQALAQYELRRVRGELQTGLGSRRLDVGTRAHLEELASRIERGLQARNVRGI